MPTNEPSVFKHRRLGRLPVKSSRKALMFADFAKKGVEPPKATHFWRRRSPFPLRTFGNNEYGDCTRAKQAVAHMRMERLECRVTPKIDDAEVIRVYKEMSDRRYGGGDNGAYEVDALDDWRNPETTFRDTKGRPLTIDAYTRLNPFDHHQVKLAMASSGAKGIAICINLPLAFSNNQPPKIWDVPDGTQLVGRWLPGSWGGHSMWARDYDEQGIWLCHTWGMQDQLLTWRAAAVYMDEAHLVVDSLDVWRKKKDATRFLKLGDLKDAVNAVSSIQIP
jgi:hypothetical protein